MDPIHAMWIARGEKLADLCLALARIRFRSAETITPILPVPSAEELARRNARMDAAMRDARQLRSEAFRSAGRQIRRFFRRKIGAGPMAGAVDFLDSREGRRIVAPVPQRRRRG